MDSRGTDLLDHVTSHSHCLFTPSLPRGDLPDCRARVRTVCCALTKYLIIADFHCHVIENKNQNRSIDNTQHLRNEN